MINNGVENFFFFFYERGAEITLSSSTCRRHYYYYDYCYLSLTRSMSVCVVYYSRGGVFDDRSERIDGVDEIVSDSINGFVVSFCQKKYFFSTPRDTIQVWNVYNTYSP